MPGCPSLSPEFGEGWEREPHRRGGQVLARLDVTDEFPFLVTRLSPYYDR